jgi:hypothetical protein
MRKRLLLRCAVLTCIASTSAAGPSQPPVPAPRPPAVLKDAAARKLDPLQALCLSGTGPLPDDKLMSDDILRIYGFAQARGVALTAPTFADATGSDTAPTWRVCTALASLPATPLKGLEPFAIVQIAATPGWGGQCVSSQDKIQDCLDALLQRIDKAEQVATGTPRIVFAESQPDPDAMVTAISIPTRNKPPAPKADVAPPPLPKADQKSDAKPGAGAAK